MDEKFFPHTTEGSIGFQSVGPRIKIAGGMFGLESEIKANNAHKPPFLNRPHLLFLSARCAIYYLINLLKPAEVWLPSFLGCSILQSILPTGIPFHFYPVAGDLRITASEWIKRMNPNSLVVLIDYFGFPCDQNLIQKIHNRRSFVLEDASQALLSSNVGLNSDWVVFSPRKFIGIPDGGILLAKEGMLSLSQLPPLSSPPAEWWLNALEACIARREFDKSGGSRHWFNLFRNVEATFPVGFYSMSEFSRILLEWGFDYSAIATARRRNFQLLAERLYQYAIYPELEPGVVPLGFPVRVPNRDYVRESLYKFEVKSGGDSIR